jgi:hypothetical protein
MWQIEKIVKKGDYLYAVVKEHPKAIKYGYVLHHRVVMENHLGRLLRDDEIVHHKDENKHNNQIENLEVMDAGDHARFHSTTGRACKELTCAHCGKVFIREVRQIKGKGLCSRRCNALYNRAHTKWLGRGVRVPSDGPNIEE